MLEHASRVLTGLGYKVETQPRELKVALPLACSVRLAANDGGLETHVRFGFMPRRVALPVDAVLAIALTWLYHQASGDLVGDAMAAVSVAIPVLIIGWDVYRLIITESMITRVHLLLASAKAT